jgi:hypothetical protein
LFCIADANLNIYWITQAFFKKINNKVKLLITLTLKQINLFSSNILYFIQFHQCLHRRYGVYI